MGVASAWVARMWLVFRSTAWLCVPAWVHYRLSAAAVEMIAVAAETSRKWMPSCLKISDAMHSAYFPACGFWGSVVTESPTYGNY
jgi:hypothetical protein